MALISPIAASRLAPMQLELITQARQRPNVGAAAGADGEGINVGASFGNVLDNADQPREQPPGERRPARQTGGDR